MDAFSAEEAARSAKTALEFLDEEWEGERALEGEARLILAEAERMAGDIDGALRDAEAAIKIFEREKLSSRAVRALVLAAETAWQARRVEETTRLAQRGMDAARQAGDNEALRNLLTLAALLSNLGGEYEKANEFLEEAGRLAPAGRRRYAGRGSAWRDAGHRDRQSGQGTRARQYGTGRRAEILTNVFELSWQPIRRESCPGLV